MLTILHCRKLIDDHDERRAWELYLTHGTNSCQLWCDGLVVSALDQRPRGRGFESAGCRAATVGQLLFAPWAWAYSTLHPLGVGKLVPAISGKVQGRYVRRCLGVYLGRYIKCSTFTTGFREFLLYITATGNPEHRPTPSQLRLSGYNFDLPNFV